MLNIIESIRMRLKRRVGCFGLYGYDFMIDEQMKVWLIEINVNPALTTNTNTLVLAIPPVVEEAIRTFCLSLHEISSDSSSTSLPSRSVGGMFREDSSQPEDFPVEIVERIQMYLQ